MVDNLFLCLPVRTSQFLREGDYTEVACVCVCVCYMAVKYGSEERE